MIPYKTIIHLERKNKQALYIQLTNQFIELIKNQTLTPKTKLPGSRVLAKLINVHRKTVIACYDELIMQGWLESIPQKGTYIHAKLPILKQQDFSTNETTKVILNAGFKFDEKTIFKNSLPVKKPDFMSLNDGVSDVRLAPTEEISIIYRRVMRKKSNQKYLTYGSAYGNIELRKELVKYLNETRGLHVTEDNILITRGSQMGIYLVTQLLLKKGDYIIVGKTNYSSADLTFKHNNARILRVTVDESGINTNEIAILCKKHNIKAVYTTPHHHHPTTVTLSADRRMHLLNLANEYHFAILEDDYDYDFHYNHAPILPLASHDTNGNVIYIGSVCKTVAPVFRIGYLVAPKNVVDSCAQFRMNIDRQGDAILELTFAHYIKYGNLDRHIKKTLKIYKNRRDLFCKLLKEELSTYFQFEIPKGGMAIWVHLDKKHSWKTVSEIATSQKLHIGNWQRYRNQNTNHNAIRIGFSTYNEEEIKVLIGKFKIIMEIVSNKNKK